MYLLIPGRHQILTQFQCQYITGLLKNGLANSPDINGEPLNIDQPVTALIFAVTSANHSNTRRNPLPFYLRAISIETFSEQFSVPSFIYGVDDVGTLPNFASYTVKRIKHDSDGSLDCTPENTVIICSTPVYKMYSDLGFRVLPAELTTVHDWQYRAELPWHFVEQISTGDQDWYLNTGLISKVHPASLQVWKKYRLGEKVQLLFKDTMIGNDGDLTETRDYNVYVRQMDEIAAQKFHETAPFIQQGRIGDIGCAVGSWLRLTALDERFRESDLYGIEVSRRLYERCIQRKENGEFNNPFVFFAQKNAVTDIVFEKNSMNTIHTSSLTHEIESYGSRTDLLQFIYNRYNELAQGGVWINRDVVGPFHKSATILMQLNKEDGMEDGPISGRSTYSRFLKFATDFRKAEGYRVGYSIRQIDGTDYIQISLKDAAEFISRKDYTDNWDSEMHETFCYWDFEEWKAHLVAAGFQIHPSSKAFTNEWIAENRWKGKVSLFKEISGELQPLPYPVTTMILVGIKQ